MLTNSPSGGSAPGPTPLRAQRTGLGATLAASAVLASGLLGNTADPAAAAGKALLPGVGADDHRVAVDSVEWPWSAIGRVNNTTGRICTGTLVAGDAVLTAAHCLVEAETGRTVPASAIHFLAGYRRGEYLAHAVGTRIETGSVPQGQHPADARAIAGDWAIVRITPPLEIRPIPLADPPESVMPMSTGPGTNPRPAAGSSPDVHLQRAGYSQDRPHMLAVHDGCRVTAVFEDGDVLLTDCDATHGDSGSPLLLRRGTDAAVVGVTSAVVDKDAARGAFVVSAAVFRNAVLAASPAGARTSTSPAPPGDRSQTRGERP